MIIHLTPAEILQAGIVGLRRRVDSINKKSTDVVGSSNGWENELEGALAEMAVAKALGSFFDPNVGKYGTADVGDYHVRQTKYHDGHLRIERHEKHGKYLLVTGQMGEYNIRGWIDAEKARQERFLCVKHKGRPPAYWIPQSELESV